MEFSKGIIKVIFLFLFFFIKNSNLSKSSHKTSLQQKNKQGLDVLSLSAKVGAEECIQKLTEYGLTFRDYSTKDLKFCEFKCGDLFPQVDSGTLDALIEHCITSNFSGNAIFFLN